MPRGPRGERRPSDVGGRATMVAKIATSKIEEELKLMRTLGRRPKQQPTDQLKERPKIYVTPLGARYIKAQDLLQSRRGRQVVKRMIKLFGKKQDNSSSIDQ